MVVCPGVAQTPTAQATIVTLAFVTVAVTTEAAAQPVQFTASGAPVIDAIFQTPDCPTYPITLDPVAICAVATATDPLTAHGVVPCRTAPMVLVPVETMTPCVAMTFVTVANTAVADVKVLVEGADVTVIDPATTLTRQAELVTSWNPDGQARTKGGPFQRPPNRMARPTRPTRYFFIPTPFLGECEA